LLERTIANSQFGKQGDEGSTMNLTRLMFVVVLAGAVVATATAARAQESAPKAEAGTAHAEGAAAEEHEPDRNPMAFDPDLAVFSFVIFLILVGILGKFAWPTIVKALDERERKIGDNIAAAEARNEESKRLFAEHEAKLAATAGEIREMLEKARGDAESTRKRIEIEGQKAAQDELNRAVREIGRAREAAVQELAVASANIAVDLARGVVQSDISPDRQKQLVRDALSKLSTATPSKN
jgi:F-type H+-transporting ATPase subunit b